MKRVDTLLHLSQLNCKRDWELNDSEWSSAAWMSDIDLQILELAITRSAENLDRGLRCFEWGSGRSSLHFSRLLDRIKPESLWISVEYNRSWFEQFRAQGEIDSRCDIYQMWEPNSPPPKCQNRHAFLVFDCGELLPMKHKFSHHRVINMEDYVNSIGLFEEKFDLIFVDGRKRNQCLFAASQRLSENGLVFLHDAWRPYYALGSTFFRTALRAGQNLMVASNMSLIKMLDYLNMEHLCSEDQIIWVRQQ
jgi:hypothetical protein